ncbi:HD domain-containing protein [Cysteiniphilum sp. 6C5]|uniref:HD domain-containing protein n=1 Tax=unclassified Cysteiniphilum TaxID=2610889 RepID=UPI003F860FE1
MSKQVAKADNFAASKHNGQLRKYTGEPYIVHPRAVKALVGQVDHTEEMLIASLLHDTVEDTDTTLSEIEASFGKEVAELVYWLTDVSQPDDGNRAIRKALDRAHISKAPPAAKTIKIADLIDNSKSIFQYDKQFGKVYFKEKILLLEVLKEGDQTLLDMAHQIIADQHWDC